MADTSHAADRSREEQRLARLIDDARAEGSVLVRVGVDAPGSHGSSGSGSKAAGQIDEILLPGEGRDVFTIDTGLARRLRDLGVGRITVVGFDSDKAAATCRSGQAAGFTVDLASLSAAALDDPLDESDEAHGYGDYEAEATAVAEAAKVDLVKPKDRAVVNDDTAAGAEAAADAPATPPKVDLVKPVAEEPEEEPAELPSSIPLAAGKDSPPVGEAVNAPLEDDDASDAIEWDDTWALRGDTQPGHGVRGWLTRKINEVREKNEE